MLDNAIKTELKELFSGLDARYTFLIASHTNHPKQGELADMLQDVSECSRNISCEFVQGDELGFGILRNGEHTGITFKAVPGGHEFTSLLLAVLNADGKGKNLPDEHTAERIKALNGNIRIETYVSLECTNCPDVVQSLNIMALLNPGIEHYIIDGAIYNEQASRLNIQAVPTVYANGELVSVGRATLGELLNKLENRFGSRPSTANDIKKYDAIIAGGGPAGVTAAIYLARKGMRTAIIAERIGGQVNETQGIENIPSIPYTTGKEFAQNLRTHLQRYPVHILENRTIAGIHMNEERKQIDIQGGERLESPILIAATGASWRRLNVPGEEEYIGRGVAFCPHCDGPFYKGKDVAVIGGGNSGVEAAIDLAGICRRVIVVEFTESLKADTLLQKKLFSLDNVEVITNGETTRIVGDGDKATGIIIKNRNAGNETHRSIDGVFVQIGLTANSGLFTDCIATNNIGEIPTDKNGRTGIKGFYAAGDVTDVSYKQIVIAMGEGAKAALTAFEDYMHEII